MPYGRRRTGCQGRNTGILVSCVLVFLGFGLIVRGAVSYISYDEDRDVNSQKTVAIAMLAGGAVLTVAALVVGGVAIYKYKSPAVSTTTTTMVGGNPGVIVNQGYNHGYTQPTQGHVRGAGTNQMRSYPPPANQWQTRMPPPNQNTAYPPAANQRQPYIPSPNQNTAYPPAANQGYNSMQNSYPPPNQNPAFLNPAFVPAPPSYSSAINDPSRALPTAPPPAYDVKY